MVEKRAVSEGTNETQNQSKQLAVRFAPEVAARIEADAAAQDASPTEIVRAIVCEHYGAAGEQTRLIGEIRDLIEDRFRHTVYEISRTRSSLYNIVEQSEPFGLDRAKLKLELDGYAAYYNHIHGEAIGIRRIIVEIVRNFVECDREFQAWLKHHSNGVGDANGGPTPASMR